MHMEACSSHVQADLLALIVLLLGQHLWGCFVPDQQQLADVMKEIASWKFASGPARLL